LICFKLKEKDKNKLKTILYAAAKLKMITFFQKINLRDFNTLIIQLQIYKVKNSDF